MQQHILLQILKARKIPISFHSMHEELISQPPLSVAAVSVVEAMTEVFDDAFSIF